MMGLVVAVHIFVCVGLIIIVLVQRGRGGGLVESFSGLENMFGVKTSVFLTRTTTIFSIIFFITCLLLTFFSLKQSRSLLKGRVNVPVTQTAPVPELPKAVPEQAAVPVPQPKMPPIKLEEGFRKETPAAPLKQTAPVKGLKPIQDVLPQEAPGQATPEKAATSK